MAFQKIKRHIDEHKPGNVKVKYVVSNINRGKGYVSNTNPGWEAKDLESKYVTFLK